MDEVILATLMCDAVAPYDLQKSQDNDLDIKGERLTLQVIRIEMNFLLKWKFVTTVDLSPTGKPRADFVNTFLSTHLD